MGLVGAGSVETSTFFFSDKEIKKMLAFSDVPEVEEVRKCLSL